MHLIGIPYFQRRKKEGKDSSDAEDDHVVDANPAVGAQVLEQGKNKGKGKGKEDLANRPSFAKAQRDALQNYLLGLVRAVVSCALVPSRIPQSPPAIHSPF